MKLSIIIVNYNVKYFLEQCLCSVRAAIAGMEAEVLVVDNHSADGSVEYLRPRFPEVTFIENKDNPGFAKANNQAIRIRRICPSAEPRYCDRRRKRAFSLFLYGRTPGGGRNRGEDVGRARCFLGGE